MSDSGHITVKDMPTAQRLEAMFEQAKQEGREAGLAQGAGEIQAQVAILQQMWAELAEPFQKLDDDVVDAVSDLAILIARHLVRRELKTAPGEVVAVVREALKHIPLANRDVQIFLHPDDLEIVEKALSIGEQTRGFHLEADPSLTRGGCVVETEVSHIDASVEARLASLVSQMLGGDRHSDTRE